ncbi:hypothetical protein HY988_05260, partial [Candidatus Micrarchaeota archaeon]|nr:hypothetical protein [Candidatus Micrarchaeota archaeon]
FAQVNVVQDISKLPVSCQLTPPTLTLGTREIGYFSVACKDLNGDPTDCGIPSWQWTGLNGGTILAAKSNEIFAYTDSLDGSKGSLNVTVDNKVTCGSEVNVVNPIDHHARFECTFDPDKAIMNVQQTKHFNFSCTKDGVPTVPDVGVVFFNQGGLDGTTSNPAADGVDFTAGPNPSAGQLVGEGLFNTGNPNIVGALAFANIGIINGGNPTPTSCTINPPKLELGPLEVALFTLSCKDITDTSVDCGAVSWLWQGLSGDFFVTANDSEIYAFTDSPAGSKGFLLAGAGAASCVSNITVPDSNVPDRYVCTLDPNNVNMKVNEGKFFKLSCTKNGLPFPPGNGAVYFTQNGLDGQLSNQSTSGTTFTSSNVPSAGQLVGIGQWVIPNSPIVGAVAFADVQVGGGVINLTNNTNDTIPVSCNIAPYDVSVGTFDFITFNVECKNANDTVVPCTSNTWLWNGLVGQFLVSDNTHADGFTTSPPGSKGLVTYVMARPRRVVCNANVNVINSTIISNVTNITQLCGNQPCQTGPSGSGSTTDCGIFGNGYDTFYFYPGSRNRITINCGKLNDQPCSSVQWGMYKTVSAWITDADSSKAIIVAPPTAGASGTIIAQVPGGGCSKEFVIGVPACFDIS